MNFAQKSIVVLLDAHQATLESAKNSYIIWVGSERHEFAQTLIVNIVLTLKLFLLLQKQLVVVIHFNFFLLF
jgi:hypothetical protein